MNNKIKVHPHLKWTAASRSIQFTHSVMHFCHVMLKQKFRTDASSFHLLITTSTAKCAWQKSLLGNRLNVNRDGHSGTGEEPLKSPEKEALRRKRGKNCPPSLSLLFPGSLCLCELALCGWDTKAPEEKGPRITATHRPFHCSRPLESQTQCTPTSSPHSTRKECEAEPCIHWSGRQQVFLGNAHYEDIVVSKWTEPF